MSPVRRPRAFRTLPVASVLVLGLVAGLTACGSAGAGAGDGVIKVVAGENFWGDIAGQIGGSHVQVTSIITDPDTDPHEYETNPANAAAVAEASLVIENGAGYDDFLSKLLAASGTHPTVLDVASLVGATGSDANPHLWYSPDYVLETAKKIETELAAADPADEAEFAENLTTFEADYAPYKQTIATIKSEYAGTAISYTERVPGYLVEAAGLHLGTPADFSQAVEDDADPSPQSTADFDADITQHKVAALLYNSQVVDDQTTKIKQLAESSGVPIVGVSETVPADYDSFSAWQIAQAKALLAALQKSTVDAAKGK